MENYKAQDPVILTEDKILKDKIASQKEIDAIKAKIKTEIEEAAAFADASPLPDPSELYTHNYVQEDYPYIRD